MKHKVVRIDNLMYKGCEPHWCCVVCSSCVPFHCFSKDEYANQECRGVRELSFIIPRGKVQYAKDMRKAAELLEKWGER